jgi:hypothetical protein
MPQHLNQSARSYVEKIGALYERARSLVSRRPRDDSRLQMWEWHRASARACVEEAALIYSDGLRALLKRPVTVNCRRGLGAPLFECRAGGDPAHSFRVHRSVLMETPQEREAVAQAFGDTAAETLAAFAEGLRELQRLGGFKRQRSMNLQPDVEQLPQPDPGIAESTPAA